MNSKKIQEIMNFVDGIQHETNGDYALITQLRSSLFFLDKSLEQKQKDLEKVSEKLKGFFNAMIAPDPEITHESASEADEKVGIVDLNKS
nr:MAG TPA: hypothetical protein [Caudoviricetes sp.]